MRHEHKESAILLSAWFFVLSGLGSMTKRMLRQMWKRSV